MMMPAARWQDDLHLSRVRSISPDAGELVFVLDELTEFVIFEQQVGNSCFEAYQQLFQPTMMPSETGGIDF